jgi:hypothetical protein
MIHVSVEQAVKDIRKEFRDLTNQEFNTGVSRAINHTLAKTKTAASKEIRAVYNVPAKYVGRGLTVRRANRAQVYGYLIAEGKPIPLSVFKPRQTKEGVSVLIKKGNRQLIRGAFITTMSSGHSGVFARGAAKAGGGFQFRHKRTRPAGGYALKNGRYQPIVNDLSVNELSTVSIPKAFSHNAVLTSLKRTIEEEFPKRMMHELLRVRG